MRLIVLWLGLALCAAGLMFPGGAAAAGGSAGHRDASRQAVMPAGWNAGPVHRWTGYSRPSGSRRVRELQRRLNRRGYHAGPVDGLFGPRTERATRRFQARHGLEADAVVGPRTLRALRHRDHRHRVAHRPPRPVTTGLPAQLPPVPPAAHEAMPPSGTELPVVPVLIAIALLGMVAFVSSYVRTTARIRAANAQRDARPPLSTGRGAAP
jgi:hypothetical protein